MDGTDDPKSKLPVVVTGKKVGKRTGKGGFGKYYTANRLWLRGISAILLIYTQNY